MESRRRKQKPISSGMKLAALVYFLALIFLGSWVVEWLNVWNKSPALLLIVLPGYLVPYLAIRLHKRRKRARYLPHCCQSCGYDLTGNTSGRCPECGTFIPATLQVTCEKCQREVYFPPQFRGSRQTCSVAGINVPHSG